MAKKRYLYLITNFIVLITLILSLSCDLTKEASDLNLNDNKNKDLSPPIILIDGANPDTIALESGDYNYPVVKAIDLVYDENTVIDSIDLSENIVKNGSVNTTAKGLYEVCYTVLDEVGNEAKVILTVVVVNKDDVPDPDTIKPEITISGENPDTINVGQTWNVPTFSAFDNKDGDISSKVEINGEVDNSKVGENEITFQVSDIAGNVSVIKLIVVVIEKILVDTIPPVLSIKGSNPDTIIVGEGWSEPIVTANDNVDGNIESKIKITGLVNENEVGEYEITYTVSDNSGNITSMILKIVVIPIKDTIPPVITIDSENPLTITINDEFVKPNIKAIDNIDEDISDNIQESGSVKNGQEGSYEIKFTVSDAAGNTAVQTLVVNVIFAYPVHKRIKASTFWCGEGASGDNDFITNTISAWDGNWGERFGLEDHPLNISRDSDFIPTSPKFTGNENPYYCALPYNDYDTLVYDGSGPDVKGVEKDKFWRKVDCYDNIHWGNEKSAEEWGYNYSLCKNRWVKIKVSGSDKYCYAQWEDAGPYYYNDHPYVFGSDAPANTTDDPYAGIDLSPSVGLYLGQKMNIWGASDFYVDWEFIEESEVPDGPWKKHVTTSQVNW